MGRIRDFLNKLSFVRRDKRGVLIDTFEAFQVSSLLPYSYFNDFIKTIFNKDYGILSCDENDFNISYNSSSITINGGYALIPFDASFISNNYGNKAKLSLIAKVNNTSLSRPSANGDYYCVIRVNTNNLEYTNEVIMKDSHNTPPQQEIPGVINFNIEVKCIAANDSNYFFNEINKLVYIKVGSNQYISGFIIAKLKVNNPTITIEDYRSSLMVDFNQDVIKANKCVDVVTITQSMLNTILAIACEINNLQAITTNILSRLVAIEQELGLHPDGDAVNLVTIANTCEIIQPNITSQQLTITDNDSSLGEGEILVTHKVWTSDEFGPSFSIIYRRHYTESNFKVVAMVPFTYDSSNNVWVAQYKDKVGDSYLSKAPSGCVDFYYKARPTIGLTPIYNETSISQANFKPKQASNIRVVTVGSNYFLTWDSLTSYDIIGIQVYKNNTLICNLPPNATSCNITSFISVGANPFKVITRRNCNRQTEVQHIYYHNPPPS